MAKKKVTNKVTKKSVKKTSYPKIYQDKDNNYLSIKLKPGIESKSYLKKGILFLEDENGEVVEIQVMG